MKTPQNQKRLTNVAIVRLKKAGIRVEVACYPNTVEAYRDKIETDLDKVLQSRQVFVNVSKGQLAKLDDVEKAFGTADEDVILREIVEKGELQQGEKEREIALQKIRKEIASCLAAMSVNPTTLKPYAVSLIEKVMKDVHFKPSLKVTAKKQAKELLELLAKNGQLPIQRANMRLKITVGAANEAALRKDIVWEEESRTEQGGEVDLIVLVKPGVFRLVEEVAKRENAVVLVVSLAAVGSKEDAPKKVAEETKEAKVEEEKKPAVSSASAPTKRMQKEEQRLAGLAGVLNDDDDDDWKNEGKKGGKGRGKGGKKKR